MFSWWVEKNCWEVKPGLLSLNLTLDTDAASNYLGGGGNLGVILVRVCEPVFQNLPHSHTWPLKNGPIHILPHPKCWPIHILPFDFLYPFFAGCYTNITVNSCNTKKISSLEKSLSEKYVHIPGCQKNGVFHIGIQKKWVIHIFFVEKRGPIIYLAVLKRGLFGTHIRTMPYIGSYHPPPPPPPHTHTHIHEQITSICSSA